MKRKLLSITLAFVMMVTLFIPTFSVNAEELEYKQAYAIRVDSFIDAEFTAPDDNSDGIINGSIFDRSTAEASLVNPPYINLPGAFARWNEKNVLGIYDATQTGHDDRFTGLRWFDEITYEFGEVVEGDDYSDNEGRLICNNPSETEPDLSLTEVTWSAGWHTEAVEVFLIGVKFVGSDDIIPEYSLGTVYNRTGDLTDYITDLGTKVAFRTEGTFTHADIYFNDLIESAEFVKVVDRTTESNTPTPTSATYKWYDDGYDLDALKAWYTIPKIVEASGAIGIQKTVDGTIDGVNFNTEIFTFNVYGTLDGVINEADFIATISTDNSGAAILSGDMLVAGNIYAIVETGYDTTKYATPETHYVTAVEIEDLDIENTLYFNNTTLKGKLRIEKYIPGKSVDAGTVTSQGIGFNTLEQSRSTNKKTGAITIKYVTNNWFKYTPVSLNADNGNSFETTLISGRDQANDESQLSNVGKLYVTMSGADLKVSYEFNPGLVGGGAKIAVVNDPKDFLGINNIPAPGQLPFNFNGSNEITIPAANLPANFDPANFYIYIHLGVDSGIEYTEGNFSLLDDMFTFNIYNYDESKADFKGDLAGTLQVAANGFNEIILLPGKYIVEELIDGSFRLVDIIGVDENGAVTIIANETTTIKATNSYEEKAKASGAIVIQKTVDGTVDGVNFDTEIFTFNVYGTLDDVINEADFIATISTDNSGAAILSGDMLVVDNVYAIVETGYDTGKYLAPAIQYVTAVDKEDLDVEDTLYFNNVLKKGYIAVDTKLGLYSGINSVTGQGTKTVTTNWFEYSTVDYNDLMANGFVTGNLIQNKDTVGKYTLTLTEDGKSVIVDYTLEEGHYNFEKNNFNAIHVELKNTKFPADVKLDNSHHDNFKGDTIALPADIQNDEFYMFLHLHTGTLNNESDITAFADTEFTYEIYSDEAMENLVDTIISSARAETLSTSIALLPGTYYVKQICTDIRVTLVDTNPIEVEVVYNADGTATIVTFNNAYTTN